MTLTLSLLRTHGRWALAVQRLRSPCHPTTRSTSLVLTALCCCMHRLLCCLACCLLPAYSSRQPRARLFSLHRHRRRRGCWRCLQRRCRGRCMERSSAGCVKSRSTRQATAAAAPRTAAEAAAAAAVLVLAAAVLVASGGSCRAHSRGARERSAAIHTVTGCRCFLNAFAMKIGTVLPSALSARAWRRFARTCCVMDCWQPARIAVLIVPMQGGHCGALLFDGR